MSERRGGCPTHGPGLADGGILLLGGGSIRGPALPHRRDDASHCAVGQAGQNPTEPDTHWFGAATDNQ